MKRVAISIVSFVLILGALVAIKLDRCAIASHMYALSNNYSIVSLISARLTVKMDSESLTQQFFSWTDANEDDYSFPIIFVDARDGGLSFTLSDFNVDLNFME